MQDTDFNHFIHFQFCFRNRYFTILSIRVCFWRLRRTRQFFALTWVFDRRLLFVIYPPTVLVPKVNDLNNKNDKLIFTLSFFKHQLKPQVIGFQYCVWCISSPALHLNKKAEDQPSLWLLLSKKNIFFTAQWMGFFRTTMKWPELFWERCISSFSHEERSELRRVLTYSPCTKLPPLLFRKPLVNCSWKSPLHNTGSRVYRLNTLQLSKNPCLHFSDCKLRVVSWGHTSGGIKLHATHSLISGIKVFWSGEQVLPWHHMKHFPVIVFDCLLMPQSNCGPSRKQEERAVRQVR